MLVGQRVAVVAALVVSSGIPLAHSASYIPVPMVPGAVSEIAFSINNSNIVAGSYRDSANVEHGFFGPLDGSNWTTFDAPFEGTTGTEPRYIGDDGAITGIVLNPSFTVGEEFYRTSSGKFKIFKANGEKLDGVAQGIGRHDKSVGDYISADGKTVGYLGQKGKYLEDFRLHLEGNKKIMQISPRGRMNINLAVVGFYAETEGGSQLGFVQWNRPGEPPYVMPIGAPGAVNTALEDVNEFLLVSGQGQDADGNMHAFTLNLYQGQFIFTDLDPMDGSTSQQAWGINDNDLVALSTSTGQSYIYCPQDNPDDCPTGGIAAKGRIITVPANARQ